MADIGERLIDPSINNISLRIKRSKLPFRKAKGVRREPEKIELFLAEKEHLASIKNRFLPLEPCCSRTLIVRLERIDDLIKKYEDKKKSNNNEAVCIVSPRKINNKTQENSVFTNDVYGENLSQEDIPIEQSSSQLESEKNYFTDNYQVGGSSTLHYPMKQLYKYANNFWSLDCIVCNERFPDRLELHKHATLSHPGMQISFCDVCAKPFFGKKSLCQHITSKHKRTPKKSPIKTTESYEKNQVPVEKIANSSSRSLAKKKSFSLNSKTQNSRCMNLKSNSMFENNLPSSNETQTKKYMLRHNKSEFHKNLFETVIHHSLNLMDKEENSRSNRRTTRSELKTFNETNKMITPRKRKASAAQVNVKDNDLDIRVAENLPKPYQKRRKVENSPTIVVEKELKIGTKKKQATNVSRVNEINGVPETEKFNYSCVKSEKKIPIPLIKMEEQITDWFPEDFASVSIGTEISRRLDSSKEEPAAASSIGVNCETTRSTKKLEKSFNKMLNNSTSLESEIDISNEVSCIDLDPNDDTRVTESSKYVEETNIISTEEIYESLINKQDENYSIIDEIIVIQLKSDDSGTKTNSEVSEDSVCRDIIEKSKNIGYPENFNFSTVIEQDQHEIEKLPISFENSKQNKVDVVDEVECICVVENEKPEVVIIEENSSDNFENVNSGECVIMEPIEENGGKIPDKDQNEQNICNNFEHADSNECIIVEPTEDRRESIPEEAKQDPANNIENTDSSECVMLEATRNMGEAILEKDSVERNISNNFKDTDSSDCAIMKSTGDREEENPKDQVDRDISGNIEKPVPTEDKGEEISKETQVEQNDSMNNIESEDPENSEFENNGSNVPVTDSKAENNLEEQETNSNKSAKQEENVELNISDKSNTTMNSESGSNVENSTAMVTRRTLKIVDQSILIPPAFSTTWTCTDCSISFDEYLNLLLHKTEVHRYACTECNKFFDGKSNFLLHMNTLHPIKLRKGLDHAAEQARINELMLQAFKLTKPKEPNNNSLKKRKLNTDSKEKSSTKPAKRVKTDTKNKTVIDNFDSVEISSCQPVEENKSDEMVIVASGKSDSSGIGKVSAEPVRKIKKIKNNKKRSDTLMDNIDSEEPARPANLRKKGKNVKKNKTVIANMDSEQILSSKSSGESKVEQDGNAMMNISGKTNYKKKRPAKSVKTILKAKTVKKSKVDSKQKSASVPAVKEIAQGSEAVMNTSGRNNLDSEWLSAESAKCENKVDRQSKIMMDAPEETNLNEKSSIDPAERIRNTEIDQDHEKMMDNIDSKQKSSPQSEEEHKADEASKAVMDVSQEIDSKEKTKTKLIKKTKIKKITKVTNAKKTDSKKKKPLKNSTPNKKSKTVQNNSKKTKKNNSKRNAKTNKKMESSKLCKIKLDQEDQGMSTSRNESTSKKNFETGNSIQKDTEPKSDHPTNTNFISGKENVDPQSLINRLAKKSMGDKKTSWMCIKCEQHFLIRHEYILHSFYSHEDMTLISICDKCGEVLTSIESSKNHTCMDVIVWCCQICSMAFTTGVEFVQHNRVHHLEISVLHTCDTCYRTFLTESMSMKHQEEHDISNITLSKIATVLHSDKLKRKSVKTSCRKTGKSSSRKSEQSVNKKSVKAPRKKKEKTVKDKKSVKVIVKKSKTLRFKKPVKSTPKKVAKVKNPRKVSTKKPATAPTDKPTKVSKKKSTKASSKESAEESTKVSNDPSKELSETSSEEAEKIEKSKKKSKKSKEKSSKVSFEISVKPSSKEPERIFKKPREFGPKSRKYLPAKFHFFNYQTFQSAFVKIQMPCLFCEDVFRTSAGYINHLLRTHHTSGEECQICRITFVNQTMIQHMLAVHAVPSDVNKDSLKPIESLDSINEDKDKPINMDTDFIIKHMDKKRLFLLCQYHAFDHILKNETFLCPWCNKIMEHPRHYRIHFLTAHDKICVICNVEFEISQVAALHKSKVHGYVGSYLWFAEIIVRTLVNSKRYGDNPKDIMIHMIGDDISTYKEIMDNLTDGKVITDLNNRTNSCNRSISLKSDENDISKNDKIMKVDTSNDCQTKSDDSPTNCECKATNDPQQNNSKNENGRPIVNDNCLTKNDNNVNTIIPRMDTYNELFNLNKDNEILEKLI